MITLIHGTLFAVVILNLCWIAAMEAVQTARIMILVGIVMAIQTALAIASAVGMTAKNILEILVRLAHPYLGAAAGVMLAVMIILIVSIPYLIPALIMAI